MKTLGVFLCVVIFVLVESHRSSDFLFAKEDFVVFHAIKGVLKNYHSLKEPNVHLIYGGNKSQNLAEKLLLELPVGVTMHVTNVDAVEKFSNSDPAIYLFDSGEHYMKYMVRIEADSKVQVPIYPKFGKIRGLFQLGELGMGKNKIPAIRGPRSFLGIFKN
jgi:hypothetical protein